MLKLNIMLATRGFKKRKLTGSTIDIWYRKDIVVTRDKTLDGAVYITFHHLKNGIVTSTTSFKATDPEIHDYIDKLGKEASNAKRDKKAD